MSIFLLFPPLSLPPPLSFSLPPSLSISPSLSHLQHDLKRSLFHSHCCVPLLHSDDKRRTWHSGPIVKRLAPRLVSTRSGTIYHLEGPLYRVGLEKLEIGDIAMKFEDGFPKDWLSTIHNYLLQKIKAK